MESLTFEFGAGRPVSAELPPCLVGVVASGNLEVLLEYLPLGGACRIEVNTAASGFAEVWRAVLADFHRRHPLGDLQVSINDMGATPAVVSLRLDQAVGEFVGGAG